MTPFAKVPIQAAADDRLSKNELRVLIALFSYADRDGECHPSKLQIEQRTGIPAKKISSITASLCMKGWLSKSGHGGRNQRANYQLSTPGLETEASPNSGLVNEETSPKPELVNTNTSLESGLVNWEETSPKSVPKTSPDLGLRNKQTNEQTNKEKNTKKEKSDLPAHWRHLPDDVKPHVSEALVTEFTRHRKAIRKPITLFALTKAMRAAIATAEQGITQTADRAIEIAIEAAWQGINPEWIKNRLETNHANSRTASQQVYKSRQQRSDDANDWFREIAAEAYEREMGHGPVQSPGNNLPGPLVEPIQRERTDAVSYSRVVNGPW